MSNLEVKCTEQHHYQPIGTIWSRNESCGAQGGYHMVSFQRVYCIKCGNAIDIKVVKSN